MRSFVSAPAYPARLTTRGWWPVTGIAWTGRGKITAVDVSTDGGETWHAADIIGTAQPCAHTRFEYMWRWDGKPAKLMSRAHDETGGVQPLLEEFKRVRGKGTDYHFNSIRTWNVAADGSVTFGG